METEIKIVNKKPKEQEWKTWDSFEVGDVLEYKRFGDAFRYAIGGASYYKELFLIYDEAGTLQLRTCDRKGFREMRKVGTIKKVTFAIEE